MYNSPRRDSVPLSSNMYNSPRDSVPLSAVICIIHLVIVFIEDHLYIHPHKLTQVAVSV